MSGSGESPLVRLLCGDGSNVAFQTTQVRLAPDSGGCREDGDTLTRHRHDRILDRRSLRSRQTATDSPASCRIPCDLLVAARAGNSALQFQFEAESATEMSAAQRGGGKRPRSHTRPDGEVALPYTSR